MSTLTGNRTAEPISRDQILRRERGQGNMIFSCSADHEQDWQPYPVDPYPAICDDRTKQGMDQPGKVANPARGQLNKEK